MSNPPSNCRLSHETTTDASSASTSREPLRHPSSADSLESVDERDRDFAIGVRARVVLALDNWRQRRAAILRRDGPSVETSKMKFAHGSGVDSIISEQRRRVIDRGAIFVSGQVLRGERRRRQMLQPRI